MNFIRQRDSMQCGATCLCMIANHFGLKCSIRWIDQKCHATSVGISLKDMIEAAETIGIESIPTHISVTEKEP